MKFPFLTTALILVTAGAGHAQSPASAVTPSTTSEAVRGMTDALSGAARDTFRQEAAKAKARAKAEKAGRTIVPLEKQPLTPKR